MVVQITKLSVLQFSPSSRSGENKAERNHFRNNFLLNEWVFAYAHLLLFQVLNVVCGLLFSCYFFSS